MDSRGAATRYAAPCRPGWAASPVERLAALLRARDVPIGVVTDGRWWAVVWAPRGKPVGAAVWDASLWSEEPESLAAFVALLERRRFLGVAPADRLPALLERSASAQEEVTTALGGQVRAAVEMLVRQLRRARPATPTATFSRDVSDDDLYAGVVTVMMRVVFLLFAEERRLLPKRRRPLRSRLLRRPARRPARATRRHPRRADPRAPHRRLASAARLHPRPARRRRTTRTCACPPTAAACSTLTATRGSKGRTATPPPVDDLTVLRMLEAVQYVRLNGERRRLTFRALDVEQIGYVYEGLLELEVRTATEPILFLRPTATASTSSPRSTAIEIVATTCTAGPPAPTSARRKPTRPRASAPTKLLANPSRRLRDRRNAVGAGATLAEQLVEMAPLLAPRRA